MKKVETTFVCDDCGALLPAEYIHREENKIHYFDNSEYNRVSFPINQDRSIHVNIGLEVDVDYGPTYREICPKCRVKWLKKVLSQFEEVLDADRDT